MEGVFSEVCTVSCLPLEAFDDDELRGGCLLAQLLERGVLRPVVPLAQAPYAFELQDDQALWVPLASSTWRAPPRTRYLPP